MYVEDQNVIDLLHFSSFTMPLSLAKVVSNLLAEFAAPNSAMHQLVKKKDLKSFAVILCDGATVSVKVETEEILVQICPLTRTPTGTIVMTRMKEGRAPPTRMLFTLLP